MRSRIDQMATEFTFLCQSYINQYCFLPNEHTEKAKKFISAMKYFKDQKPSIKKLITLILLFQGLEDYLVEHQSEKFLNKVREFLNNNHLNNDSTDKLAEFIKAKHWECARLISLWIENNDNISNHLFNRNAIDFDKINKEFLIKISNEILKLVKENGCDNVAQYYKNRSQLNLWLNNTDTKRQEFINMHYRLWDRDKSSFGSCLRNTKVNYSQSLGCFVKHAQNYNNRSREAFVALELMDKEGKFTDIGEEKLANEVELNVVI